MSNCLQFVCPKNLREQHMFPVDRDVISNGKIVLKRHCRDLHGPAWGSFGPTEPKPEVYLQICLPVPDRNPTSFYSKPNKTRCVYSLPWLSRSTTANNSWTNYLTKFSEHFRCFSSYRQSWRFFVVAKNEFSEKARYIFWLESFEHGPTPNIICARRSEGQAGADADLGRSYC
jgi:hypothetical protein